MSPLRLLEWTGAIFLVLCLLLLIGLGVRYILFSPPCPDPQAHEPKTNNDGRTVDL